MSHSGEARSLNDQMAQRCQACDAACCKKGLIFLPDDECARLERWLAERSPAEVSSFNARLVRHAGFALYDQRDRCQFLTDDNLCRLHSQGVKPQECFWWPAHVYTSAEGQLEVRVSTSCCTAHELVDGTSPVVADIQRRVDELGADLIRAFREKYAGSYENKRVAPITLR